MSLKKCTTRPSTRLIFLGIICDTDRRRFEVPETKLIKLETILKEAIQSRFITFHDLAKLAGKSGRILLELGGSCTRNSRFRRGIPGCGRLPGRAGKFPHQCEGNLRTHEVLSLLVKARPDFLRASTTTMDVDNKAINKAMFYAVQRGWAPNEQMHKLVCNLFWLQVHADFTLKLRWIPSGENSEVDRMTCLLYTSPSPRDA